MKDSKAVKLVALAYDEGHHAGFAEGCAYVRDEYEEDSANAKSQAYEAGYQQGLAEGQARGYKKGIEDQGRKTLELMAEAHENERHKIEATLPKLSVWFRPCGSGPAPDIDKIEAIKAIRQAYVKVDGRGLKAVKDMVETESHGARIATGQPLPQSKAVELYLRLQAAGFDPVLRAQD